jgi:hypothetical protein
MDSNGFPKIVTLENIAILGMENAGRGCPSHNEELLTSQGWWTCCWSGGHDHGHSLGRDAHMDLLQACLDTKVSFDPSPSVLLCVLVLA